MRSLIFLFSIPLDLPYKDDCFDEIEIDLDELLDFDTAERVRFLRVSATSGLSFYLQYQLKYFN